MHEINTLIPEDLRQRLAAAKALLSSAPVSSAAPTLALRTPLRQIPAGGWMVEADTLRRVGIGKTFVGFTLDSVEGAGDGLGVLPAVRKAIATYLDRLPEMVTHGRGIALTGGQGIGKSGILALIAQAAYTLLPEPRRTEWDYAPRALALYTRMPLLMDFLGAFRTERDEWERRHTQLRDCTILLIDEAQAVMSNDRAQALLLDLVDYRVSEGKTTCLAMNRRWDELREDPSPLLQQIREKMHSSIREVVLPGESRRALWTL